MERGHIIPQRENMLGIADIDGDRRGGQDFLDTLYIARLGATERVD
jgi:hypothetical protein